MIFICPFCNYDLATNQRELGQHVRFCAIATSVGGAGVSASVALGGGGGGGGGGGTIDAGSAMDTSQVLASGSAVASVEASFVEEFDWEGGGGAPSDGEGGADDESTGTGADDGSSGNGMNCSVSTGSSENAHSVAVSPPQAAPMVLAAGGGGAGSQRYRDLATSALLSPPGICASIGLYGVLSQHGVSGNGYEIIVDHLYNYVGEISCAWRRRRQRCAAGRRRGRRRWRRGRRVTFFRDVPHLWEALVEVSVAVSVLLSPRSAHTVTHCFLPPPHRWEW